MIRASRIKRRQRGDTLVEVLICIGVVGAVLAGAFVVTNRSQLGVRDSQERAEAAKVVEGQLELLRSNAKLQKGTVFHPKTTGAFCMDRTTALPIQSQAVDRPNAKCSVDSLGNESTEANAYSVTITHQETNSGTSNAGQLFKIQVSWNSVTGTGDGKAQETMYYRLYP